MASKSAERFKQTARSNMTDDRESNERQQSSLQRNVSQSAESLALQEKLFRQKMHISIMKQKKAVKALKRR